MLYSLTIFGGDFIYKKNRVEQLQPILKTQATILIKQTAVIHGLILLSLSIVMIGPVYNYFDQGQRPILLPLLLPFVDPKPLRGYILNTGNQMIICFLGLCGNFLVEGINCMLVNNLRVGISVINYSLMELDSDISIHREFTIEMKLKFKNILVQIQDLDR